MKKILTRFIISILVLCSFGYFALKFFGTGLDRKSQDFADSIIFEIANEWNEQIFIDHASPELLKSIKVDDIKKMFEIFKRLGNIVEYGGSRGESRTILRYRDFSLDISANYIADAKFTKGPAKIFVSLSRINGRWYIKRFNIDSKVFYKSDNREDNGVWS
jgi:hypothetical protein